MTLKERVERLEKMVVLQATLDKEIIKQISKMIIMYGDPDMLEESKKHSTFGSSLVNDMKGLRYILKSKKGKAYDIG